MLTDILFLILAGFISGFVAIFSVINYVFPVEFQTSVTWFLNHLAYARGVFPVNALLNAVSLYVSFIALFYGLKIALWVFGHTPWIGSSKKFPTISHRSGKN